MLRETEEEYEIQHFNVSSTEFIIQFLQNYEEAIVTLNSNMKDSICKHLKLDDTKKEILHETIQTLTELQIQRLKQHFKKIEPTVHAFFAIPKHIVLKDDEIHEDNFDETVESLQSDVQRLEEEYKKKKLLIEIYNRKLKSLEPFDVLQEKISPILNADLDTKKVKTEVAKIKTKIIRMHKKVGELEELKIDNEIY